MSKLTEEQLRNWLESDEYMISHKDIWSVEQLFKVPLNDDFIFIYYKQISQNDSLGLNENLKNVGLYYKQDGCIYNPDYHLKSMCEEMSIIKSNTENSDFAKQLTAAVRDYVNNFIDNDVNNLAISELSTEYKIKDVDYFIKYTAKDQARALFLSETEVSDIEYECHCNINSMKDMEYLRFITDKDTLIANKAEEYIRDNQEDILAQFYQNSALRKELQKIYDDPEHDLYRIKAVKKATEQSGAKTVKVTVVKNFKEFTFRYDADRLCMDPKGAYSNWGMNSSDEREFERIFGKVGDFDVNDISRITYGRNVIYDSSEFDIDESEDEAIIQSM